MQNKKFCYLDNKEMQKLGLEELGYDTWDALWSDYTVFSLVRNPYDRAGSSYDYILGRHEVRFSRPLDNERVRSQHTDPRFIRGHFPAPIHAS